MAHLTNPTSLLYLREDILNMQQAAAGIEIAPDLRAAQAFAPSLRLGFIPSGAFQKTCSLVFGCGSRGAQPSRSLWLASRQAASSKAPSRKGTAPHPIHPAPPNSRPPVGLANPLTIMTTANQSKSRLVKIFSSGPRLEEMRHPIQPAPPLAPSRQAAQPVNANENSQSR